MNPFSAQEINNYRALFPVTRDWVYFNHAAVAPISIPVVGAIQEFTESALKEGYTAGPIWRDRIESVRRKAASLIGATAEEIAFVKNTSHGLSLVCRGLDWKLGDEVILSEAEFPSNVYPWMALEKKGVVLKKIPCIDGELRLEALEALITPKTRLVSLSSIQYGNGFRLPIARVGKFCREKGILFFVDAIQSLGAFPLSVEADFIDFLSSDAHKWMLGPEGIGIFFARKELLSRLEPCLVGWNTVKDALRFDQLDFTLRPDAQRFEEGSHNSLSIYALGAAIDLVLKAGIERIAERILTLTDLLVLGLKGLGLKITSSLKSEFRSGIVTFKIPNDPKGSALQALERELFSKRIYTSLRQESLRISPHFYNTEGEIEKTLNEINNFLKRM
jgi:selenocysteine lyase/cysteine desulfurase